MQCNLTERAITALKPKNRPYEATDRTLKGFLVRVQPTGFKTYYFSYTAPNRKRKRIKIGCVESMSLGKARARAKQLAVEVNIGTDVQVEKCRARHRATLAEQKIFGIFLNDQYGPWLEEHRKSGKDTFRRLNNCFAFLQKRFMPDINPWEIEQWRSQRLKAGAGKSSINRDLFALRGCLNKAVEWGVIPVNPILSVKAFSLDRNNRIVRYLSDEEEMSLREALDEREQELCEERDSHNQFLSQRNYPLRLDLKTVPFADYLKPMVLLSLNTGMRRGEVFHLQWSHVNLMTRNLTVVGEHAKSGLTRHIPLNEEAHTVLALWHSQRESDGLVFPGKYNQPRTDIKKAWRALLDRAGIRNFRWHDMRHNFASQLVMAGEELNTIRELLGHQDYNTTLRYAHLAPSQLISAVEKLKPRVRTHDNVAQLR